MFFYVVTGFSESSEGEAMGNALGSAASFGEEAESVHVLVLSVSQVDGGWQVVVKVVIEPRIKPERAQIVGAKQPDHKHKKDEEDGAFLPLIHFYAMSRHADILHEVVMHQFTHAFEHVMEPGPLWEEALNFYPDVDFYEATHPAMTHIYDTSHPDTQLALSQFVDNLRTAHDPPKPVLED